MNDRGSVTVRLPQDKRRRQKTKGLQLQTVCRSKAVSDSEQTQLSRHRRIVNIQQVGIIMLGAIDP